jgi:hypothetical protein
MSNLNFFRVMNKFSGVSLVESPIVLTCALELANFDLDPVSNKNFDNFKAYGSTYFSRIALSYEYSGTSDIYIHNLYAGWYPTGSFTPPYDQQIYQFSHTESLSTNALPNLSLMEPFTSSINSTSSFSLPMNTMGSGLSPSAIAFSTIQVPHAGSLIHFGSNSSSKSYIIQYDLDTNYDVTTLNTASREVIELRKLTASQNNSVLQTSYNNDGSQIYQITQNNEGNISPYNHWTILHVIDLSTPYDLSSYNSSNTSSYILENELSNLSGPYPSTDSNKVNVSTFNSYNINIAAYTSSMYYTNTDTNTVIKFRINSDRSLSNEELLTVNDFPMEIRYSAPTTYLDSSYNYQNFFISNSLGPYNETVNINRTSSCLAPYDLFAGILPA